MCFPKWSREMWNSVNHIAYVIYIYTYIYTYIYSLNRRVKPHFFKDGKWDERNCAYGTSLRYRLWDNSANSEAHENNGGKQKSYKKIYSSHTEMQKLYPIWGTWCPCPSTVPKETETCWRLETHSLVAGRNNSLHKTGVPTSLRAVACGRQALGEEVSDSSGRNLWFK